MGPEEVAALVAHTVAQVLNSPDVLTPEAEETPETLEWLHRLALTNGLISRAVPSPRQAAHVFERALIASLACSTRDSSMSMPGNFTAGGSVMWNVWATLPNVGSTCGVLSVR